jgi:hypothetical protein
LIRTGEQVACISAIEQAALETPSKIATLSVFGTSVSCK